MLPRVQIATDAHYNLGSISQVLRSNTLQQSISS